MADFHFHLTITDPRVSTILEKLVEIGNNMSQMDDEIAQLQTDVTALRGVEDSAIALINGIAQKIADAVAAAIAAGATPAQLQAVSDLSAAVKTDATDLAAAVAANP